jgi:hypothetical protein
MARGAVLTADAVPGHHILAVPQDVTAQELAILARTRWRGAEIDSAGRLALSKYSSLAGPSWLTASLAERIGFPAGLPWVFVVSTLRERGDLPFPGSRDATGIARAFPDGLPIREEARVANWLVAAARRLGGAVRFDHWGMVLCPQADAAIDLTVYSNLWLDPAAALNLAQSVTPAFRLATELTPWAGPAGLPPMAAGLHAAHVTASSVLPAGPSVELTEAQRAELHERADEHDVESLSAPPMLDRYALRGDFGEGGTVWVEVSGADVPSVLRDLAWTEFGVVGYGLRWDPADPADLLIEFPDARVRAERADAAGLLARLALAIHRATGIEILDADGFPVSPRDL